MAAAENRRWRRIEVRPAFPSLPIDRQPASQKKKAGAVATPAVISSREKLIS
jgi:hypothetical protein